MLSKKNAKLLTFDYHLRPPAVLYTPLYNVKT